MDVDKIIAGLSEADFDAIGDAIKAAECPNRQAPYGGFDYGYNTDFYGPEPEGGRYVIRDFRDPSSESWGRWVHQTPDNDEHEEMFERLTRRHIAQAAVLAVRARLLEQGEG